MLPITDLQKNISQGFLSKNIASLEEHLQECKFFPKADRLEIYQNNIFSSLHRTLKSTFERVYSLVGEKFFKYLTHQFIALRPPQDGRLLNYGKDFPKFIKEFETLQDYPYLSDVALLDWAHNEAFYASDSSPFNPIELEEYSPESYLEIRFGFPPSAFFIESNFPLKEIWDIATKVREEAVNFSEGKAYAFVFRPEMKVCICWLEKAQFIFLQTLFYNGTLKKAYEQAIAVESKFDLQGYLVMCFQEKFFTNIQPKKEESNDLNR